MTGEVGGLVGFTDEESFPSRMSSTAAIEAQWKQEMVITFYGLFWIFSGKSKMMQDWRKLHSFKPNFGGEFSVSVVLTTDKCFADVSHKNLKVSVFFDEKTVLRCLTFEKREKKVSKSKKCDSAIFSLFPSSLLLSLSKLLTIFLSAKLLLINFVGWLFAVPWRKLLGFLFL